MPWLICLIDLKTAPGTNNVLLMSTDGVLDIRWMKDLVICLYIWDELKHIYQIVSLEEYTQTPLREHGENN